MSRLIIHWQWYCMQYKGPAKCSTFTSSANPQQILIYSFPSIISRQPPIKQSIKPAAAVFYWQR